MADIKKCGKCEMLGDAAPCDECYHGYPLIPLPPTTATEGEAKELVEKFKRWHFQAQPIQQEYFAKQSAITHCHEMMIRLKKVYGDASWVNDEFTHYTNLIKQIEKL